MAQIVWLFAIVCRQSLGLRLGRQWCTSFDEIIATRTLLENLSRRWWWMAKVLSNAGSYIILDGRANSCWRQPALRCPTYADVYLLILALVIHSTSAGSFWYALLYVAGSNYESGTKSLAALHTNNLRSSAELEMMHFRASSSRSRRHRIEWNQTHRSQEKVTCSGGALYNAFNMSPPKHPVVVGLCITLPMRLSLTSNTSYSSSACT